MQTKNSKVLALKGRRQVGCITSAERGVLSTACFCMSAVGHFVPPMLIFPRLRLTEQLKHGAPADTLFICNGSGWMTVNDFTAWFDHFLSFTRPTKERPILLILDGHASHTKNLALIEKARTHHVTVLSLPPHCSHKLQPLDVSFMGPIKSNLSKAIEKLLKTNPGKVVSINDVSSLLGTAFMETASTAVAVNGFQKTGISPFNKFIFNDDDFAPADVTDIPLVNEATVSTAPEAYPATNSDEDEADFYGFEHFEMQLPEYFGSKHPANLPELSQTNHEEASSTPLESRKVPFKPPETASPVAPLEIRMAPSMTPETAAPASLEKAKPKTPAIHNTKQRIQTGFDVSPAMILPLPKVDARKTPTGRKKAGKKQKSEELTSDVYRIALKASQANHDIQQVKRAKKRFMKMEPKAQKKSRGRKNDNKENLNESLCDACGECFSQSYQGEGWERCLTCTMWYHQCYGDRCPECP